MATSWILALSRPAHAEPSGPTSGDTASLVDDVAMGQSKFRVLAGADGLGNLVVVSVVQDGDGFLWVGTDDGVYRFDGARFSHFSVEHGLISSQADVVGVDPEGHVCVGASGGLVCWDGARFSHAKTQGLPAVPVIAIASRAGKMWVGTKTAGLWVQDEAGVLVPARGWPGAPTSKVRALWADAEGVVVADGATVWLSSGDGVWRGIGDVGLGRDRIDGVLRDRHGGLWIRTTSHMWHVPRGAARASDLIAGLPTGYDTATVPDGMAIGPRGEVLVATDVGVAYRDRDRWRVIDRSAGMPPGTSARTLFVDREGTIWLGSQGLFQLRGRGVIEHYDVTSGLPGNVTWSFQRDRHGQFWVGTNRCLARATAGRWECLPGTEGRIIRSFVFPPQGGVFVGGSPADVLYLDPEGHPTSLGDIDRPTDHATLALALGPNGDLWIATKNGLGRLPGAIPGPIERVAIPGVRIDSRFSSLAVVDGNVWTAADEGVAVLDHGAWHLFDKSAGFRSSAMRYVIARADDRLCVAYKEAIGATCYRYRNGAISDLEHIGPAEGLTTGKVYFLGEDHQRRLWFGTGNGVDVVTPHGIDHFDASDGLAGDDATANAFLLDTDGSVWLGATGGATHFFAQHYDGPPQPPRTTFLAGRLGEQSILRAPSESAAIEVPHDQNALALGFASSSILDGKRVEYALRLSPLETAWSSTQQHDARYPALPPGSYRFDVRARIGNGSWGPTSQVAFKILPAWWQTRWFLALLGITVLAAIAAGFTWRQRTVLIRRTRQLHARADASFRAVIDLIPELISVHRDRKLIYLNLANRRFLGVDGPGADWEGLELIERVHPDDRKHVVELFRRVRDSESQLAPDVVELRMRGADGSWRTCEVSAILVDIGGVPTVVASGRDVTERKRMRAKLLVSDRMASLGTLAAGIAHEINNPLAYVTGNLDVLAETLELARRRVSEETCDELRTVVNDARDGAERVRKIVHGLRSFSRSEEEEKRLPLSLPQVLDAALRMTANEVRHRAQLVRELGPTPLIVADEGRLTQVFINLLVNAAHAIPEGRSDDNRITVRTRTESDGRVVAEIEDTGKGMAPEVQARVFDPFFTTKDVGEGTGLGLSICHGIISALGGQIAIDSVVGRGTLVRVILPPQAPVVADVPARGSQAAITPPPGRRHRVMLVDDEPRVAQTLERMLRRDYDVTVAQCGREAIEHVTSGVRFDAIVSDVMMPNMTGIELLEELQRVAPDQAVRLIFLSGGAFTAQTRERLDQLGALQLEKPITAKQLRACLIGITSDHKP
jgi:PAS domain S-box-containing protein